MMRRDDLQNMVSLSEGQDKETHMLNSLERHPSSDYSLFDFTFA